MTETLLAAMPDTWNAMQWLLPAVVAALLAIPIVVWSNFSRQVSPRRGIVLSLLKAIAIVLLVICLLEPMSQFEQAKPGANSLIVMADASQSLDVKDIGQTTSRAQELAQLLKQDATWLNQLERNFELRRYTFDERATNVVDFEDFAADGRASEILKSMATVGQRADGANGLNGLNGKPSAGIILLTDGNESTQSDLSKFDWSTLPPVYPVVIGGRQPLRDLAITGITTSQTNFESAPVTIKAELLAQRFAGNTVTVELVGQDNTLIESQEVRRLENGKPFAVRFKLKPENRGLNVFEIRAFEKGKTIEDENGEATLVNNKRLVIVDGARAHFASSTSPGVQTGNTSLCVARWRMTMNSIWLVYCESPKKRSSLLSVVVTAKPPILSFADSATRKMIRPNNTTKR